MLIEQKCNVPVPIEPLWALLIDPAAVSRCMPGLESFAEVATDEFEGAVRVRVGPISLRLLGRMIVHERNRESWTARMSTEGKDSRIAGAVHAKLRIWLIPLGPAETELNVHTDATVLGKLGEFGQPIMKKSADKIIQQFVANITEAMETSAGPGPAGPTR